MKIDRKVQNLIKEVELNLSTPMKGVDRDKYIKFVMGTLYDYIDYILYRRRNGVSIKELESEEY